MNVITKQFLNENAFYSYPIDAKATYEPYGAEDASRINSLLLDLKISVPSQIANTVFVANIKVTNAIVSMVLMGVKEPIFYGKKLPPTPTYTSSEYATFSAVVLATVTAPLVSAQNQTPIPLTGELPGVGGWVIFGPGIQNECNWSFSGPASAALSSLAVTRYDYGGVFSVAKLGFIETLDGAVDLVGQNEIEVVPVGNNTLSIRFSGNPAEVQSNLALYRGECGNRPESNNCTYTPIQSISNISPSFSKTDQVNEIVLVLDQPLYATLVDVAAPGDYAGFAVASDVPLEGFCGTRLLLPPAECSDSPQFAFFDGKTSSIIKHGTEVILEITYLDSIKSIVFSMQQQHPSRPNVSVFKPRETIQMLGEYLLELHFDLSANQWQIYSDSGPSLKLFGPLGYNLTGFREFLLNGLPIKASVGPLDIFQRLNHTQLKLTVDSTENPTWAGIYNKTGVNQYTHVEQPNSIIRTFAFNNAWALYVNKTLTAGGDLTENGFSTQLQNYENEQGVTKFRTLTLIGLST